MIRPRHRAGRWREDELVNGVLVPARSSSALTEVGGRDWLHARLYARPRLHEALLAECLPVVLESLPRGVDRWFFLRPTWPDPHLRLSFGGDARALWTDLLSNLRCWIAELVTAELAGRMAVDVCEPVTGDAAVIAEAEDVLQADSDAALALLRLAHARAFTIRSDVLVTLGLADLARAFHGRRGTDRAERVSRGAPAPPEVALLAPWWERRAEALARYGDRVRRLAVEGGDPELVDTVLDSLLRMHANRVANEGDARWSG
jgi:hypothetical protein